MMQAIIHGLGLGLLLSISVGPVLFSIIKQSLNNGFAGGLSFVLGVSASDITLVLISNVFTELFESVKPYRNELGMAGCVFLVSVGVYFLFFKKVKVDEEGKQVILRRKRDYIKIFMSGYLMNTLNPGVFFFWIYASTSMISHTVNERIIVFITCLSWMLGADLLKVFLAGKIRKRLTPHNIHILNKINGILLIVFGIALIWGIIFYAKKL